MTRSKKILFGLILFSILFIVDRYTWMPNRVKQVWLQESGINLGDPIAYNQDFILKGSVIIFQGVKSTSEFPAVMENRKSKFYLTGCYFGNLYIYDLIRNEMITYIDN